MAEVLSAAENGLSGQSVRGAVDNAASPDSAARGIEETVKQAADLARDALDLAGKALGKAVDVASDKAFQSAGDIGGGMSSQAGSLGQSAFSWSGYVQALGILCLLLAALWFGVWAIRRYGKFNFLPRPGALPRDALAMEAQMPLGPRKGLMVVRFLNRRLLLGVTEHQISLLTEENAREERHGKDFQGIMEEAHNANADSDIGGASA